LEVTGVAITRKKKYCKTSSSVTYLPSHRQAGILVINIQSTLRIAPDLCKDVSLEGSIIW